MRTQGEMTFAEIGARMGMSRQLTYLVYKRGMSKLSRRLPRDPDFSIAVLLDQMNGSASLDSGKGFCGMPERTRPRCELASG